MFINCHETRVATHGQSVEEGQGRGGGHNDMRIWPRQNNAMTGAGRRQKGSQVWAVKLFATKIAAVLGIGTRWQQQQQHNDNSNNNQAEQVQETICSAHTTPTANTKGKGKRQFIRRLSLSLSLKTLKVFSKQRREGKSKQILAAFWLIANSTRSWLQIKQNAKRGNRVRCELIIFMSISNEIVDKVDPDTLLSSKPNQLQFYFFFFSNTICFFFDLYEIWMV